MLWNTSPNLESELKQAKEGYRFLKHLLREYHVDKCVLFLDDELCPIAIKYFNDFYTSQKPMRFLAIYTSEAYLQIAKQAIRENVYHLVLSNEQIKRILRAFALIDLSSKLVVISSTEPYDNHSKNMVGRKNVSLDELVCMDIYGLNKVPNKLEEKQC